MFSTALNREIFKKRKKKMARNFLDSLRKTTKKWVKMHVEKNKARLCFLERKKKKNIYEIKKTETDF